VAYDPTRRTSAHRRGGGRGEVAAAAINAAGAHLDQTRPNQARPHWTRGARCAVSVAASADEIGARSDRRCGGRGAGIVASAAATAGASSGWRTGPAS